MPEPPETYLPRASEAQVREAKLRDYALDPEHPDGRHKARVFRAALGLAREDWEDLRQQILQRVGSCPVTKVAPRPPDAVQYEVVIPIDCPNGESRAGSPWTAVHPVSPPPTWPPGAGPPEPANPSAIIQWR